MTPGPLLPKQVLRLCALGLLARHGRLGYADLAAGVDGFTARLTGPILEMRGSSLELLRYEGLIVPVDDADPPTMALAPAGREEFAALMGLPLSVPMTELVKLAGVLKLRFLDLLPADRQAAELAGLVAVHRQEAARLEDLRQRVGGEPGLLGDWLALDIDLYRRRADWLADAARRLPLAAN